jgi:hypothetical protein
VLQTASENVWKRTKKSEVPEPDHAAQTVDEITGDADIPFIELCEESCAHRLGVCVLGKSVYLSVNSA